MLKHLSSHILYHLSMFVLLILAQYNAGANRVYWLIHAIICLLLCLATWGIPHVDFSYLTKSSEIIFNIEQKMYFLCMLTHASAWAWIGSAKVLLILAQMVVVVCFLGVLMPRVKQELQKQEEDNLKFLNKLYENSDTNHSE